MLNGVRFLRDGEMDLRQNVEPPPRDELVREAVDQLPKHERHVIERYYFGGATMMEITEEMRVKDPKLTRRWRKDGLTHLAEILLEAGHPLGPLFAARLAELAEEALQESRDLEASRGEA